MVKDVLVPLCVFIASAVISLLSVQFAWLSIIAGAVLLLVGLVSLRRRRARIAGGAVVVPSTDKAIVEQAPLITVPTPPMPQPVLRSRSLRWGLALLLGPLVIYALAAAGLLN